MSELCARNVGEIEYFEPFHALYLFVVAGRAISNVNRQATLLAGVFHQAQRT
jgi:hypothetical protein